MENRKIGEPISHVDASRRPYAAFVLRNPELVKGVDLVTYAGQLSVYQAESERFRGLYNSSLRSFYEMIKALPQEGPALEDGDIMGYSRLTELASQAFEEVRSQSKDIKITNAYGPIPPASTLFETMAYLHFLRDVADAKAFQVIETAKIGELWLSESWEQLGTEDLRRVVERGRAWINREDGKYIAIRKLEMEMRKVGQRMPVGIELGKMLEEKLRLDYGGYDWSSNPSTRPHYFNDGVQFINGIVGKANLIQNLGFELSRRKD